MVIDEDIGRFEIPMAYFSELHVVECFKNLEDQYFSNGRVKGLFEFPLFFNHEVEAGRYKFHDDAKIALLI